MCAPPGGRLGLFPWMKMAVSHATVATIPMRKDSCRTGILAPLAPSPSKLQIIDFGSVKV